ncbi:EAL domain-containing protein [Azoarcus taiwanensis]|uniref:EAL domain-containing protein n=1 Tax=Azoarcus taiwanensis TaxID=666964 RepID=A0A972F9K2_9RHOO|nr:EAL domain-containing protein [Azoarcus taiwanensis]NMG02534.1 EAL domain-containing protein [Azoarcus taiwanensis]
MSTPVSRATRRSAPGARGLALMVLVLALLATATLLTWLFVQADSVSKAEDQAYQRELRLLRQADAELDAAILAARFGLSLSYDGIMARVGALDAGIERLATVPTYVTDDYRDGLQASILAYRQLHERKSSLVEAFKRDNAVVRNSLAYFPALREQTQAQLAPGSSMAELVRQFTCSVMTHAMSDENLPSERVLAFSSDIESQLATLDAATAQLVISLLAHGRVILDNKPALDETISQILLLESGVQAERIHAEYARGHARAVQRADRHHMALYAVALLLAAYIALIVLRLARTSRALDDANQELEQRLDALLSTQSNLRLLSTVFTNASEGMLITDARARILAANPAFTQITGYPLDEVLGQTPALLRSGEHPEDFYRQMWAVLTRDGEWHGEIWNRRRDGSVYPEWLSISAVRDQGSGISHYIGVFSDMSERKAAEARIRFLAHHDTLTGLPNRVLMQDRLNQAVRNARRSKRHVAVLCLDLDRFKTINDSLGPEVGDQLIVKVAERCRATLRETDTLSRQGGDEFVIVLPELEHAEDAAVAARKLLVALDTPFNLGDHQLAVSASIGIALHPGDGSTAAALIKNADIAMYRAKERGRARYEFYAEDINVATVGKLLLENQLRRAVSAGELMLHYQPKFAIEGARLIGFEALLRWRHPEQGELSPAAFLQVAEEAGLITEIGTWVLGEACAQQARWREQGHLNVPVAVNVSAQQFERQDIVALIRQSLEEHELPAPMLELELTETTLMRDPAMAADTLQRLRAMGVTLAIDDFGTGYASLSYLHLLPVQTVKIDRSFVAPIGSTDVDGKIASAIIALAHSLGMIVVAEGVETETQRALLAARGCDQIQGYLLGKPMSAEAAASLLGAHEGTKPA